jgi:hypothetical protein
MAVNTSKTKYIIFHSKGKKLDFKKEQVIFDNNEIGTPTDPLLNSPLEHVHNNNPDNSNKALKLLGIYLDENLTFNYNTNFLCNKLSKSIYMLNQHKNVLPTKTLGNLYFGLVHPHLIYCINITSCTSKTNLKRIGKLQKKAIRIITKSGYTSHTQPLFKQLDITNFEQIALQSKLHFMHTVNYGYCLPSFSNTWTKNNQRDHGRDLRNNNDFTIPPHRSELPSAWNELADEIKLQPNKTTFKFALKDHILNLNNLTN